MFDYEKFVEAYRASEDAKNYVVWFFRPDERGVWGPSFAGPITQDGVIELTNQDAQGNLVITEIRHW